MTTESTHQTRRSTLHLNVEPQLDEGGDRGLREGIARRDIDLRDLWRQTMDDGRKQGFVTHDDCCTATGFQTVFLLKP